MKLFATLVVVMVVLATAVAQKDGNSKETQACNKKSCLKSGIAINLYLRSKALIFFVVSYKRPTTKFIDLSLITFGWCMQNFRTISSHQNIGGKSIIHAD